MSQKDTARIKKIQAGLALLILTVVIVGAIVASNKSGTRMKSVAVAQTTPTVNTSTTTTNNGTYKDGTYHATGSYDSPGGEESVKVSLTLASNKVTAASVISEANDPTAASYQASFISGYKSYVVGRDITAIKVSNVSGSSLTSQGFNDALKQIEKQAQA